jgi:guanylate kinase
MDFFIEWAEVHGNFYGTSKKVVERELARDNTVVFDIDVQGHQAIRALYPDITTAVFVTTPNMSILKERLIGRETDAQDVIDKRLINALSEMRFIKEYDYLIVNKDYEPSVDRLIAIAKSSRYKRERFNLNEFLTGWNI